MTPPRPSSTPLMLGFACLALCQCVPFPVPDRIVYREGSSGRVRDAVTHRPVAGATVALVFASDPEAGHRFKRDEPERYQLVTDGKGRWSLPADDYWVALYLYGITGELPVPSPDRSTKPNTKLLESLRVSHPGYASLTWVRRDYQDRLRRTKLFLAPRQAVAR